MLPITSKTLECLKRFELLPSVWKTDMLTVKHYRHIYLNTIVPSYGILFERRWFMKKSLAQ